MYKWAKAADYLKIHKFDGTELEDRPEEETKDEIGGLPVRLSSEMLAPLQHLRAQLSMPDAGEKQLKAELTRIATQINRETTSAAEKGRKRAWAEGDAQGRTAGAWGYIRWSLRKNQPRMENVVMDGMVLINSGEVLARIQQARKDLQGIDYRILYDAHPWMVYQQYVQAMPQHVVQPLRDYIRPKHLWSVQEGKARGRDPSLDDTHVLIVITWHRHLSESDQRDLYKALESHAVLRHLGKQGTLILLAKNVNLPATDNNVRGITLGTHLSKVPLAAFFATRGTEAYNRALGGLYLRGGLPGISVIEVVRTVVMTADLLRLKGSKFQGIIMDEKQFFDRIP